MSYTILVVEDYEDTRLLVRFQLERLGYRVIEAGDGQQAIEIVSQDCPDLILMDLSLPVVDGLTATRVIHRMERSCQIPIIVVTAHPAGDYKEQAFSAGCVDFMRKPIDFQIFGEVISRHLAPL